MRNSSGLAALRPWARPRLLHMLVAALEVSVAAIPMVRGVDPASVNRTFKGDRAPALPGASRVVLPGQPISEPSRSCPTAASPKPTGAATSIPTKSQGAASRSDAAEIIRGPRSGRARSVPGRPRGCPNSARLTRTPVGAHMAIHHRKRIDRIAVMTIAERGPSTTGGQTNPASGVRTSKADDASGFFPDAKLVEARPRVRPRSASGRGISHPTASPGRATSRAIHRLPHGQLRRHDRVRAKRRPSGRPGRRFAPRSMKRCAPERRFRMLYRLPPRPDGQEHWIEFASDGRHGQRRAPSGCSAPAGTSPTACKLHRELRHAREPTGNRGAAWRARADRGRSPDIF